jgi:hypothetical protein
MDPLELAHFLESDFGKQLRAEALADLSDGGSRDDHEGRVEELASRIADALNLGPVAPRSTTADLGMHLPDWFLDEDNASGSESGASFSMPGPSALVNKLATLSQRSDPAGALNKLSQSYELLELESAQPVLFRQGMQYLAAGLVHTCVEVQEAHLKALALVCNAVEANEDYLMIMLGCVLDLEAAHSPCAAGALSLSQTFCVWACCCRSRISRTMVIDDRCMRALQWPCCQSVHGHGDPSSPVLCTKTLHHGCTRWTAALSAEATLNTLTTFVDKLQLVSRSALQSMLTAATFELARVLAQCMEPRGSNNVGLDAASPLLRLDPSVRPDQRILCLWIASKIATQMNIKHCKACTCPNIHHRTCRWRGGLSSAQWPARKLWRVMLPYACTCCQLP